MVELIEQFVRGFISSVNSSDTFKILKMQVPLYGGLDAVASNTLCYSQYGNWVILRGGDSLRLVD